MDPHGEEAALVRAVHESRGQATPRLVYADWLDDAGRPQEAAMHRYVAEPDSRERRDQLVATHGGRISDAALALSRHVMDRTNRLHRTGALQPGEHEHEVNEGAYVAIQRAYRAADDIPAAGKVNQHNRAALVHREESFFYGYPGSNPSPNEHSDNRYSEDQLNSHAELSTLHHAAGLIHRQAAWHHGGHLETR